MDPVRQFTDVGIQRFSEFLMSLRAETPIPLPLELLTDETCTAEIAGDASLERKQFATKYEAGAYLVEQLRGLPRVEVDENSGLWNWLTLYYFDQVCPADQNGVRHPRQDALYLMPTGTRDYRRRYRHLLASAYDLVRRHGDNAGVLLSGSISVHSDIEEQLVSRLEIVQNDGLIGAAKRLYFDEGSTKLKRGVTNRMRPGTVRRLVAISQQLDLTYDLLGMNDDEIIALLPAEFRPWLA